jgi:hypothetical protein
VENTTMMQMAAYGRLGQGSSGASGIDVQAMPVSGPDWISVEMARPEGQTSNSLVETLVDWNTCLEQRAHQGTARWET